MLIFWRLLAVGACVLVAVGELPARIRAQDRYDVEAFEITPADRGSVLNVYGARTLEPLQFGLSLVGSYARAPLSVERTGGEAVGDLVGSVSSLQFAAAVGVFKHVDLGVAFALHRTGAGDRFGLAALNAASLSDSEIAFGDMRLIPRVSLYEHAGDSGFDVALLAPLWLPTGKESVYAGESLRIEPRLALDYQSPRVTLALNAGYLVRRSVRVVNTEADDQVRLAFGADVGIVGGFGVLGTFDTRLNVLAGKFNDDDVDSELLLGLRYRAGGLRVQLGAGPGLSHAITAPDYRVFLGVGYESKAAPRDADRDGLEDARDRCPNEAEDKDGFEDDDGCPEPDNDADGVADADDKCPSAAEDLDGDADSDGCPEAARDADADTIADDSDSCPNEAEDVDGFEDQDGCPEPDNDRDGVLDADDKCPDEAGAGQADGCPVRAEAQAVSAAEPLPPVFQKTVRFEKDLSDVEAQFYAQLNEVASYLQAHPELELVAVEGHADDRGPDAWNERLSKSRADAVRDALIARGVSASRLVSAGYGSRRPLVQNDSDAGRAQNRRVELRVERSRREPSSRDHTP